jgi:hypothetical protein
MRGCNVEVHMHKPMTVQNDFTRRANPVADTLEPGKGYLLFFSTGRSGTGVWTCVKPY